MDSLALFSIGNVINAFLMGILEAPYKYEEYHLEKVGCLI